MELWAGFLEHADVNAGRILDELQAEGKLENTVIFYVLGDNGNSAEGQNGTISELLAQNGIPSSIAGSVPEGLGQFLLTLSCADAGVSQLLLIEQGKLPTSAAVALPVTQRRVEAEPVQGLVVCKLRERFVSAVHGVLLSRDKGGSSCSRKRSWASRYNRLELCGGRGGFMATVLLARAMTVADKTKAPPQQRRWSSQKIPTWGWSKAGGQRQNGFCSSA